MLGAAHGPFSQGAWPWQQSCTAQQRRGGQGAQMQVEGEAQAGGDTRAEKPDHGLRSEDQAGGQQRMRQR